MRPLSTAACFLALTEAEFLSQAPGFTRVDRNRDGVLAGQELARLEKFMARG